MGPCLEPRRLYQLDRRLHRPGIDAALLLHAGRCADRRTARAFCWASAACGTAFFPTGIPTCSWVLRWRRWDSGGSPIRRSFWPTPSPGTCWATNSRPWKSSPPCICSPASFPCGICAGASAWWHSPANLAALAFVFAGCILIMGRCWHCFRRQRGLAAAAGHRHSALSRRPGRLEMDRRRRRGAGAGLSRGLSADRRHSRHVLRRRHGERWRLADRVPLRRMLAVVPALLLAIGLAAPLLLHHLQMTGGHRAVCPR